MNYWMTPHLNKKSHMLLESMTQSISCVRRLRIGWIALMDKSDAAFCDKSSSMVTQRQSSTLSPAS